MSIACYALVVVMAHVGLCNHIPHCAFFGLYEGATPSVCEPASALAVKTLPHGYKWAAFQGDMTPFKGRFETKAECVAAFYPNEVDCKTWKDEPIKVAESSPWVMLDEIGKIVGGFDSEKACMMHVPGGRPDWHCRPAGQPHLLECRLSWDAGHHMHGCGVRRTREDCDAAGAEGIKSGEFTEYACEPTGETQEHK